MNDITHPELVKALCKSGDDILKSLTPEKAHLLHMASKLCAEAGELMDAIGKHVFYEKELDEINVIEEFGDIEFYLEGLRSKLNISREMTLGANILKLAKRYEGLKYSNEAAINRADKQ